MELADALPIFTIPTDDESGVVDWRAGAGSGAPKVIEWQTEGLGDAPNGESPYYREASVMIAIDGKVQTMLGKRVEPHPWKIHLYGPRAGVMQTTFDPNEMGRPYTVFAYFRRRGIRYKIRNCRGVPGSHIAIADLTVPGRKPALARISMSCGSGGCMETIDVRYPTNGDAGEFVPDESWAKDIEKPAQCEEAL